MGLASSSRLTYRGELSASLGASTAVRVSMTFPDGKESENSRGLFLGDPGRELAAGSSSTWDNVNFSMKPAS
jgi:hypothetical protein